MTDQAAEYQELGRFIADFTFLEKALHQLCGAMVVPRDSDHDSYSWAVAVAAEVDSSRLCGSLLKRMIAKSPHEDVRALVEPWKRLSSRVQSEINWRNEVAHSWWSLTLSDAGRFELQKSRRGEATPVTLDLIEKHRKAVSRLSLEVLNIAAIARPAIRVEVRVERASERVADGA